MAQRPLYCFEDEWDLSPDQRRMKVWQRGVLGAALTLGNRPPAVVMRPGPFNGANSTVNPPPPPLTTIPDMERHSNWRQIVDEVLAHYAIPMSDIVKKRSRSRWHVAATQEMAYRLMLYGRRFGRKMSSLDVGEIIGRDHSTVLYARRIHALRIQRLHEQGEPV